VQEMERLGSAIEPGVGWGEGRGAERARATVEHEGSREKITRKHGERVLRHVRTVVRL